MLTPKEVILHHSAGNDGTGYDWGFLRYYHNTYRVDYAVVSKEEFERRLIIKDGNTFYRPWGKHTGYHGGVEKVGQYWQFMIGKVWNEDGCHCVGHNKTGLGLCFVGNFDIAPPPDGQLEEGARIVKMWMNIYSIPIDNIFLHKDFNQTSCPGKFFDLDKFKGLL